MASGLDSLYDKIRYVMNHAVSAQTQENSLQAEIEAFLSEPPDESFIYEVQQNIALANRDPGFDAFDNFNSRWKSFVTLKFPTAVDTSIINPDDFRGLYYTKVSLAKHEIVLRSSYNDIYGLQLESLNFENQLVDQRLTGFLTAQTVLFAALALIVDPEASDNIINPLKRIIPIVGIASSGVTTIANAMSFHSSATLEEQIPIALRDKIGSLNLIYPQTPPKSLGGKAYSALRHKG